MKYWLLGMGGLLVFICVLFCCCKVASWADERIKASSQMHQSEERT